VTAHQLARVDVDGLVAALTASRPAAPLTLNLFPGVSVPLVLDQSEPSPAGMSAYSAHSPDDPASSATVVVDGGTVYAVITYKNAVYEITHLSNGVHRIAKINQDSYPGDKVVEGENPNLPLSSTGELTSVGVVAAATPSAENEARPGEAPSGGTVVSVAILATEAARSDHTNWLSIARAAVSDANASFRRSGVALTFRVTSFAALTDYDESHKSYEQMLADLSRAPGVRSFRDSTRSDLVAILRDDAGPGGSLCGLSYLPDLPSARTADRAYSVVNIACAVPNHSYVHEAGHNMGLRHDRYVERAFGRLQSKYNYGFSNPEHRVRTIMAYPDYCSSKGVDCTRVGFFSDPFKRANGGVLGVNVGQRDPAFNARRLNLFGSHSPPLAA
jgi:Metallo-peptidase family M12B Reprolysin-like